MKRNRKIKLVVLICFFISIPTLKSQQVNTMYFMDNVPERSYLNPAFQPYSNFYLGFPVLGYTQFGLGNNSVTIKDFLYDQSGQIISFLHPNGSIDNFYNALSPVTSIEADAKINLLNFGFRTGKSYWNFTVTERFDGRIGIPKDFMKLLLYGTPDMNSNTYDLKNLGVDLSLYTEAGLGYSRRINDKWSVGGKLKFLYGSANASLTNTNLDLNAGKDAWTINGTGSVNVAIPGTITVNPYGYTMPANMIDFATPPSGLGGGLDLGLSFKPIKNLNISASIIDLGLIYWQSNTTNLNYTVDYKFNGIGTINSGSNLDVNAITDSIKNALLTSVSTSNTNNSYWSKISPKLNIGAEYGLFNNKLGIGVLSRTIFHNNAVNEELTASLNFRPANWFNLSGSYSIFNGRTSNIGAGLGLRTGIIHWFLSADYIPLSYTTDKLVQFGGLYVSPPYNTKGVNFALGVTFALGNRHDTDRDGVVDEKDKCPETPFGVIVDKKGCPVDTDGDGVPDYLDKCPGTPPEAYSRIDQNGCPTDTDGDGVPDYLDKCSDTPKEAIGFTDKDGCLLDTDGDGVPDYLDKCPNTKSGVKVDAEGCPIDSDNDGIPDKIDKCPDTPAGVKVDSVGCPLDTDGDGVPDYLDKCPDTPKQAKGMIDKDGCLLDTDGDGVPDYLDLCPNTPVEARGFVDKNGCPLDTDGDGIPDYLDKCPNTPIAAKGFVDEKGCLRDTDNDGVQDYLDKCPTIPGVASNNGCPEIKKEIRTLFKKAMQGIQFETNKYVIKPISFKILNPIAEILVLNPDYLIEVQGHTDNVGKPEANMILSERRAKAVMDYLISKGVDAKRLTSHGYGDTKPIAPNKTTKGKALNRRVEFVVSFEKVTIQ